MEADAIFPIDVHQWRLMLVWCQTSRQCGHGSMRYPMVVPYPLHLRSIWRDRWNVWTMEDQTLVQEKQPMKELPSSVVDLSELLWRRWPCRQTTISLWNTNSPSYSVWNSMYTSTVIVCFKVVCKRDLCYLTTVFSSTELHLTPPCCLYNSFDTNWIIATDKIYI